MFSRGDIAVDNKGTQYYVRDTGIDGTILTCTNIATHEDHLISSNKVARLMSIYETSETYFATIESKSVYEATIEGLDKLERKLS